MSLVRISSLTGRLGGVIMGFWGKEFLAPNAKVDKLRKVHQFLTIQIIEIKPVWIQIQNRQQICPEVSQNVKEFPLETSVKTRPKLAWLDNKTILRLDELGTWPVLNIEVLQARSKRFQTQEDSKSLFHHTVLNILKLREIIKIAMAGDQPEKVVWVKQLQTRGFKRKFWASTREHQVTKIYQQSLASKPTMILLKENLIKKMKIYSQKPARTKEPFRVVEAGILRGEKLIKCQRSMKTFWCQKIREIPHQRVKTTNNRN